MIIRSMEQGGTRGQPSAAANNGILKGRGCVVDGTKGDGAGGGQRLKDKHDVGDTHEQTHIHTHTHPCAHMSNLPTHMAYA